MMNKFEYFMSSYDVIYVFKIIIFKKINKQIKHTRSVPINYHCEYEFYINTHVAHACISAEDRD